MPNRRQNECHGRHRRRCRAEESCGRRFCRYNLRWMLRNCLKMRPSKLQTRTKPPRTPLRQPPKSREKTTHRLSQLRQKLPEAAKTAQSLAGSAGKLAATLAAAAPASSTLSVSVTSPFTRCVTSIQGNGGVQMNSGSDSYSTMRPDPSFTATANVHNLRNRYKSLHVNPNLKGHWLHWRSLPGASKPSNYAEGMFP